MKQIVPVLLLCFFNCFFWITTVSANQKPILAIDSAKENTFNLPAHYRAMTDIKGSGSAQPTTQELAYLTEHLKKQTTGLIFIVDLRRESHAFVNGIPVSIYGYRNQANNNHTPHEISTDEQQLIKELSSNKEVIANHIQKLPDGFYTTTSATTLPAQLVTSEQDEVTKLNARYYRLFIADHNTPSNDAIDSFVNLIKSLPSDAWIHFHCRAGKGRSTTFLALFDMIRNANKFSLQEFIDRQIIVSGKDLSKTLPSLPRKQWKHHDSTLRWQFIEQFFAYVHDPKGYATSSWSDWLKLQQETKPTS